MDKPLKVMIIGAGTGGLCLAHGLARDGIAVEVFERDDSPADRQPGYRLSISATGSAALRSCLPDAQYRKLVANSSDPSSAVTFLDHELHELLRIDLPHANRESDDAERPVSRATLRRILLEASNTPCALERNSSHLRTVLTAGSSPVSPTELLQTAISSSVPTARIRMCARNCCRMPNALKLGSSPSLAKFR